MRALRAPGFKGKLLHELHGRNGFILLADEDFKFTPPAEFFAADADDVDGKDKGMETGQEEGEIKGVKVTQELFDCCDKASEKITGDALKNIRMCMDDPDFAKKYGCAPKDDDPKTEDRLQKALAKAGMDQKSKRP